ncbi:MAG TPA: FAD-binding oxidoreductase [Woeseiaceae bacterium]|nr:FAD-binding oxidoreductase [Woeseiaceae bacterium]
MAAAFEKNTVSRSWTGPLIAPASCPESADVVIVGGGIVGAATAWFLARQGVDVALCEKGHIAGEQSGRNWGWVRQQGRDLRELPMMMESMRIWRELQNEIGEDVGFEQGGCLFMARKQKELDAFAAWVDSAGSYGIDTRIITGRELDAQVEGASSQWIGAMYTASDGRAEPHKAAPAIARAAAARGATILTSCAVRGIETSGGRVAAVVTEHGTIRTSTVLCAAGAWASLFCRSLDIAVPQLKVKGTVVRTAPARSLLNGNVFDEKIGIRRRQDGGYTVAHGSILVHPVTPSTLRFAAKFLPALKQEFKVLRITFGKEFFEEFAMPRRWSLDKESPFEQNRVLDPEPIASVVRKIRENLATTFPELANVEIAEVWAGMVETSPDVVPIICPIDSLPGFYLATGFSGHGFGIGPGAGKAIAGMLTNTDSGIDLSEFRLQRFFDGSPIRPQSTV